MNILQSEIIGLPVISSQEKNTLARVNKIIFDPENGTIIAISVDPDTENIVAASDINHLYRREVIIRDKNSIVSIDEVLRAKSVYRSGIQFMNNAVYSEGKNYLGKVTDIEINAPGLFLTSLRVSKRFLFWNFDHKTVNKKDILEVNIDKIIVKKSSTLKKQEAKEFMRVPI